MEVKTCSKCKEIKNICDFQKDKSKKCGYKSQCKNCVYEQQKVYKKENFNEISIKRKRYYLENIDREKINNKIYRDKNKESFRKKSREKYKTNPLYKLKVNVRRRINKFVNNKTKSSFNIVGCSPDELIVHLELQFKEGMSWENYGMFGWHIDHIIPLSSAKTEDEIYKLCHYTNLQPLWSEENLRKGNKLL